MQNAARANAHASYATYDTLDRYVIFRARIGPARRVRMGDERVTGGTENPPPGEKKRKEKKKKKKKEMEMHSSLEP